MLWWHSATVSQCYNVTVLLCHSVTMSLCYNVAVLLCHSFTLSQCYNVTVVQCHNVTLSHCHSVTMSQCYDVIMSQCYNVAVLRCHHVAMLQCHNVPVCTPTYPRVDSVFRINVMLNRSLSRFHGGISPRLLHKYTPQTIVCNNSNAVLAVYADCLQSHCVLHKLLCT